MDAPQKGIAKSLLVHDGELDDLREVLEGIGTPFVERRGALSADERNTEWSVILSTPNRMLSLRVPGTPVRIVVTDQDSKTLRNSLHRADTKIMVRRPVHPTALRGLILHALYRGPEKRQNQRVAVGAPVRLRAGLRQLPGILADVSIGGCGLIAAQPLSPGKSFSLSIPGEVAPGKAYSLKARVLSSGQVESGRAGTYAIHAVFDPTPSQRKLKLLKETILAYRSGPATLPKGERANSSVLRGVAARGLGTPAPATSSASERREDPRLEIEQRVVALDEEVDRMLMGKDISIGGMRVSPSPHLTRGGNVKLALHLNGGSPLVLAARVHRDDGERGVVLRFHQLSAEASSTLMNVMESMPVVAPGASGSDAGYVVSELLEVNG